MIDLFLNLTVELPILLYMKSFLSTLNQSFLRIFALGCFLLPGVLAAQPLNGTYTIGGSTPDYATLTAAVTALTSNGVAGPVVFNITAGTYTEHVSIPVITGASATNTITFQSAALDSSTTIIRYNASGEATNYVFELNGTNYVRIRHLTLQPQNTAYQKAIRLKAAASNNIFSNNIMRGTNNSPNTYKALIHFYGWSGDAFKHNQILSNRFEGGGYQVWIECTSTSTTATDNPMIGNEFTGSSGPAITVEYQQGIVIRSNTITGTKSYPGAMDLSRCGSNSVIEKNKVTPTPSTNMLITLEYSGSTIIRNNFLAGGSVSINQSTGVKFYNNSCYHTGTTYMFFLSGTTTASVYNNCFSAPAGGSFIYSYPAVNPATVQINRNVYYTTQATQKFITANGSAINFATWQSTTGADANSFLTEPQYYSATDLHINNSLLPNGAGQPLAEVTEDIDGQPRDPLHPDIGADEYDINMATFQDIEMVGAAFITAPCTPASSVKIKVANHSQNTVTSLTAVHRLFGVLRDSSVYNVTIPAGDTVIIDLGSFLFRGGTQYDYAFKVTLPNGSPDNYYNNNEGTFSYAYLAPVNISERALDCTTDVELSIQKQPMTTVLWSTGATTPAIIPPGPGTYSVTVTDSLGCTVNNTYTLN